MLMFWSFRSKAKSELLRACLRGGRGLQIGEVTCGRSPHLSWKSDQIKKRDYMDRQVTPPKRDTSPTWGPPPPCKQALNMITGVKKLNKVFLEIGRALFGLLRYSKNLRRLRTCLHRDEGPQIGEVTCGGSPHLSCKRDQIKMRDHMDRCFTVGHRMRNSLETQKWSKRDFD